MQQSAGTETRLTQALILAVQMCLIVFALVVVFLPWTRTPTVMNIGAALALATFGTVLWRLRRTGSTELSMSALWARVRRDPSGASTGLGSLDLLAMCLSSVVLFLAH